MNNTIEAREYELTIRHKKLPLKYRTAFYNKQHNIVFLPVVNLQQDWLSSVLDDQPCIFKHNHYYLDYNYLRYLYKNDKQLIIVYDKMFNMVKSYLYEEDENE